MRHGARPQTGIRERPESGLLQLPAEEEQPSLILSAFGFGCEQFSDYRYQSAWVWMRNLSLSNSRPYLSRLTFFKHPRKWVTFLDCKFEQLCRYVLINYIRPFLEFLGSVKHVLTIVIKMT
jgi:hypothetical protein